MPTFGIGGIRLKERILEVAKDVLGKFVDETSDMNNIPNWDSLKTLQMIMALDEEGITIPLEKIAKIKSISDLINYAK
jgi:acyl carrier protein